MGDLGFRFATYCRKVFVQIDLQVVTFLLDSARRVAAMAGASDPPGIRFVTSVLGN
jgi:hypothetical protein